MLSIECSVIVISAARRSAHRSHRIKMELALFSAAVKQTLKRGSKLGASVWRARLVQAKSHILAVKLLVFFMNLLFPNMVFVKQGSPR